MKRLTVILLALLSAGWALRGASPVERVYIATDRTAYIAGDALWCSLFCLDGNGRLSPQSAVAYVELVSTDGTAAEAKIGLLEGRGAGSFRIPVTTPTGTYRLIAYTAVNAAEEGTPWMAGSRLVSVYNTTSTARVSGGVDLLDAAKYEALERPSEEKFGELSLSTNVRPRRNATSTLSIRNMGPDASVSLSIYHDDDLAVPAQGNSPASFLKALPTTVTLRPGADGTPETDGEVITARVRGTVAESPDNPSIAYLSSAGSPSNLYIGRSLGDGVIRFYTANIYGDREIVCEVSQLDRKEGYIEFEYPFIHPDMDNLPSLPLSKSVQGDLTARKAALRSEKELRIDTLAAFMTHREDLLLESNPLKRYHLDDYNRFPSIRETLIEFVYELRLHKDRSGTWQLQLIQNDAVSSRRDRTENILVMMDGVVLNDLTPLVDFDAMLIDDIDIYSSTFACGEVVYRGLVNFVTKKNYVTALTVPANVRVVDFSGVRYPVAYNGAVPGGTATDLRQLLYWHPVLDLDSGGEYRIEFHTPGYSGRFRVVAEGFTADGAPLRHEFAFEVE